MQRENVENHSNQQDDVELSRRGFFSRLAIGAFLSIGMPGVVYAAKSAAVKADKNQRLAHSARTAVRIPKHGGALQTAKPGKLSASHAVGKRHESVLLKSDAHKHKFAAAEHGRLHTAHADQHGSQITRVRDVYTGKKHGAHTSANYSGRHYQHGGRSHSIIQPVQREPLYEVEQEPMFLSSPGRLANYRSLAIQNPHTGDKLSLTYFEKGRYLSDALEEISFLLRDYRTGDVHPIDPELLDQLHNLKQMLGLNQPFDIVCGYRSPLTNALLHAEHSGVANNSFHMSGRAVDIRVERFGLRRIHNAALAMHSGGVGYYPESNFIHLDTGTFRTWSM
jgi:uncharacterized protein YcbK (DUF882 family)